MFRSMLAVVSLPRVPVEDMMWCDVTPASRLPAVLFAPADSAAPMASSTYPATRPSGPSSFLSWLAFGLYARPRGGSGTYAASFGRLIMLLYRSPMKRSRLALCGFEELPIILLPPFARYTICPLSLTFFVTVTELLAKLAIRSLEMTVIRMASSAPSFFATPTPNLFDSSGSIILTMSI